MGDVEEKNTNYQRSSKLKSALALLEQRYLAFKRAAGRSFCSLHMPHRAKISFYMSYDF